MTKKLLSKNLIIFVLVISFFFILLSETVLAEQRWCCLHGDCCCGEGCGSLWGFVTKEEGCKCETPCGSWQICSAGNCCCKGECIISPKNPRYYDNSEYPVNVCNPQEPSKDPKNIYLPVKLDWDDVPGWIGGNRSCDRCDDCDEGCVRSYVIEIKGEMRNCEALKKIDKYEKLIEKEENKETPDWQKIEQYEKEIERIRKEELPMDTFTTVLHNSEFIPPCSCMFKSNRTYQWQVKGCCLPNGTRCGPWSKWKFTTNPAPELKLPYDPDWQGPKKTVNYPLPVRLEWCEVPAAKSYYFQAYRYDKDGNLKFHLIWPIGEKEGKLLPQYLDENIYHFTKETTYQWEVITCWDKNVSNCAISIPSQRWTFETATISLPPPERESPFYSPEGSTELIVVVNQLDSLEWENVMGAHFYRYQIKKGEEIVVNKLIKAWEGEKTEVKLNQIGSLWNSVEKFDQIYSWQVASCWGEGEKQCDEFSEPPWLFRTTGAKPTNLKEDTKIIPVKLDWHDMPGALSYYYEVATDPEFSNNIVIYGIVDKSEVSVDYPYLTQNTNYWWRVKTCADKEGKVCGNWSETRNFVTFTLNKPTPVRPANEGEFYTYERYLRWNEVPGAKAYQYRVYYNGVEKIPLTKVSTNSVFVRQLELGEHSLEVRACLDENCKVVGEFSEPWRFKVIAENPPGGTGLVPCGRNVNVPDPYDINETEPCGFHHIFFLLRNVLDFVLWRLSLIILVLLGLYSGVIFYFSGKLEFPEPISHIKSLWKAAGIGYLIIFVGYSLINLFLAIIGYKIGIFGPWWIISF